MGKALRSLVKSKRTKRVATQVFADKIHQKNNAVRFFLDFILWTIFVTKSVSMKSGVYLVFLIVSLDFESVSMEKSGLQ